ncbi:SDR family oxidoreductase [Bradyrhizobium sp. INPA01-394B]|uniref:SDR family oxidoreductase n=1 Tax=Bradyrhizobium campsiandrae TaxID=1729892 RepID=A0ABR7UGH6_9BRAD|nr:SDR family oxidoreductase [Bradyrhizobium campsiandrae]MBC9882693.1 SDR family oxidoreductase [Bradyrhizobium campsiandrae]MBC9982686.1 SDR family oxidoreductase [Bradyrhizobium campsiandrae]
MTWIDLSSNVAVVTGGGAGIGRGIALGLAAVGANVVVLDRNEAGSDVVAEIRGVGGRAQFFACDVTSDDSVANVAEQIAAKVGQVAILVNNAGTMLSGGLDAIGMADWDRILSLNLTGYLRCARVLGRPMLQRGAGAIVHVASISASSPQSYSGAYSVSKAGVVMLSRQLAVEWGPRGVRSNVVSPGMIRTPMTEAIYQAPGVHDARRALVPAQRIGRPSDIADAVVFLASERASYITGEELVVDGGFTRTIMGVIPRPGFEKS